MDNIFRGKLPDGTFVIACGRRAKRPRCSYCADVGAQLECDGCDKPLCAGCSVSPRDGLDFCPTCARPAFLHWWKLTPRSSGMQSQRLRRSAFRCWARIASHVFLELVPLGDVARRALEQAP